jgi:hypothetical protein
MGRFQYSKITVREYRKIEVGKLIIQLNADYMDWCSKNALDLYLVGDRFESQPGKQLLCMTLYGFIHSHINGLKKKKLHGLSPQANYTDRATAACRRSDCQLLRIECAMWSA